MEKMSTSKALLHKFYILSILVMFFSYIYLMLRGSILVNPNHDDGFFNPVILKAFSVIIFVLALYCLVIKSVQYYRTEKALDLSKVIMFSFIALCQLMWILLDFNVYSGSNEHMLSIMQQVMYVLNYVCMAFLVIMICDVLICFVKRAAHTIKVSK